MRRLRGKGEKPARQRPSLSTAFRVGYRRSANSRRCDRENHGSQRRHRERIGSPPAKPMSSGFAAESTVVCAAAKNTKSLAARADGCGPGSQPIPRADAVWNINGQVLVSDVAARDVQAATSPRVSNSPCRKKVLALCGRRLRGRGEKTARQRPCLSMAFRVGHRRSAIFLRCDREKPRLAAVTSLRGGVAKGIANVSGFCSGEPQRSGRERKNPESLAAETIIFTGGVASKADHSGNRLNRLVLTYLPADCGS